MNPQTIAALIASLRSNPQQNNSPVGTNMAGPVSYARSPGMDLSGGGDQSGQQGKPFGPGTLLNPNMSTDPETGDNVTMWDSDPYQNPGAQVTGGVPNVSPLAGAGPNAGGGPVSGPGPGPDVLQPGPAGGPGLGFSGPLGNSPGAASGLTPAQAIAGLMAVQGGPGTVGPGTGGATFAGNFNTDPNNPTNALSANPGMIPQAFQGQSVQPTTAGGFNPAPDWLDPNYNPANDQMLPDMGAGPI